MSISTAIIVLLPLGVVIVACIALRPARKKNPSVAKKEEELKSDSDLVDHISKKDDPYN